MRKIEREPNGRGIFIPGQDLVVAGTIGKSGVLAALEYKSEELKSRFTESFLRKTKNEAEEKIGLTPGKLLERGATEWEFVDEGGIMAALWTISGAYEQGISFELTKIPVKQEIIEVCELFDLNPYRLKSGECVLAAADNGNDLVRKLAAEGITAAWIGKVEKGIARKVTGPGGTGFLERPQPDEIWKLTGKG